MEFITDESLCEAQLLIWLPHCLLGKCAQVCKSWSRRGAARARQMISRSRMKLDPSESIWKHLQAGQRVTMMVIFVWVTHVFTSLNPGVCGSEGVRHGTSVCSRWSVSRSCVAHSTSIAHSIMARILSSSDFRSSRARLFTHIRISLYM